MYKIKEAILVEGKYDIIKLSSIFDTLIIKTNGFEIFKDKAKIEYIKTIALKSGIIILTDSDSAGFLIRNHVKKFLPQECVKHIYLPDIIGKEKRKEKFSAEKKLGVEGISKEIIIKTFKKYGVIFQDEDKIMPESKKITTTDFYNDGLTGTDNSKNLRLKLLKELNLPENMSKKSLLDTLNLILGYEKYKAIIKKIKKETEA